MADVYTQAGEEHVVDQIEAFGAQYVGWGTGALSAVKGTTALVTEAAEARVSATLSQPSVDINQWLALMTSASGQTITEAGVFSASSAGIMILASDFTGIVLANGDKIEFTFTLEQT